VAFDSNSFESDEDEDSDDYSEWHFASLFYNLNDLIIKYISIISHVPYFCYNLFT
jgi:hypothetical protein